LVVAAALAERNAAAAREEQLQKAHRKLQAEASKKSEAERSAATADMEHKPEAVAAEARAAREASCRNELFRRGDREVRRL
jgi:hypothetical protein